MKRIFWVLVFIMGVLVVNAQDESATPVRKGRPNIPGTLQVDLGFSFVTTEDTTFNVFGSRSFNLYYKRDIRFGESKFSFHPGIGIGFDRFAFKQNDAKKEVMIINGVDNSSIVEVTDFPNVRKSMLVANYLDIPLEFRFTSNPDDEKRALKVSAGFRAGLLVGSYSKLKYKDGGEIRKLKDYQSFHLSPLRYGPFVRVGIAGFNAYAMYSITPLFKSGEGHDGVDHKMMTVGISWPAF